MRKLFLALTALVTLQVTGASATPVTTVDFLFTANCPTCAIQGAPPAVFTAVLVSGNEYQVTNITGNLGGFPVLLAASGTVSLLPTTPNGQSPVFSARGAGSHFR
jgi:hypothetical protein